MRSKNCKLSSPWEEVHHALEAFFEKDDTVVVDAEISANYTLGISCYSEKKYNALKKVLRQEYKFGNVVLRIFLYLLSDKRTNTTTFSTKDPAKNIEAALSGNELFDHIESRIIMGSKLSYCLFKKEVVQFYNDDLTDLNGLESTLAENIAEIIFDVDDVYFCTDPE